MSIPLVSGERAIIVARQHWSVIASHVVIPVLVAIAGVVAVALVPGSVSGHDIGGIKAALITALLVVVALVVLMRVLQWRAARYVLTDRRILVMRGVLSRYAESIALDRVQNTIVNQSLLARMINCGNVEIESAGRDGTEVMHRIPRPQDFENELMTAIDAHRQAGPPQPGGY